MPLDNTIPAPETCQLSETALRLYPFISSSRTPLCLDRTEDFVTWLEIASGLTAGGALLDLTGLATLTENTRFRYRITVDTTDGDDNDDDDIPDGEDPDDDNDSVPDVDDPDPLDPNDPDDDIDDDDIPNDEDPNPLDPDTDGDTIPDGEDPDPLDPDPDPDTDGDTIPNSEDPDDDNDGLDDEDDPNPTNPDSDGDSIPDGEDPDPLDPNNPGNPDPPVDNDGDGSPAGEDPDDNDPDTGGTTGPGTIPHGGTPSGGGAPVVEGDGGEVSPSYCRYNLTAAVTPTAPGTGQHYEYQWYRNGTPNVAMGTDLEQIVTVGCGNTITYSFFVSRVSDSTSDTICQDVMDFVITCECDDGGDE